MIIIPNGINALSVWYIIRRWMSWLHCWERNWISAASVSCHKRLYLQTQRLTTWNILKATKTSFSVCGEISAKIRGLFPLSRYLFICFIVAFLFVRCCFCFCVIFKGSNFCCRIKSFDFPDKGIFFELPKVLTLTDCVIRAMFTKFDHLSVHCASYLPQIKPKILDGELTDSLVHSYTCLTVWSEHTQEV